MKNKDGISVSMENYCKEMAKSGCNGTSTEILALSKIYELEINVYHTSGLDNSKTFKSHNKPTIISKGKKAVKCDLLLIGSLDSGHF